jgi:hypothetical protein
MYESADDSGIVNAVDTDCHCPIESVSCDSNGRVPDSSFGFVFPAREWRFGYYSIELTT